MSDATFAQITSPPTEATVWQQLLTRLQGYGLPTILWGSDDPIQVILQSGFSPFVAQALNYASDIAKGGLLRTARLLAETDLAGWNADPTGTFLYNLAVQRWSVTPAPPAFAIGTMRLTNPGGATTLPASWSVQDPVTGLRFLLNNGGAPHGVPAGAIGTLTNPYDHVEVIAEQPGPLYNLAAGTLTKQVTSVAGITVSNQPQSPSTNWLIAYGSTRQSPASVEKQCLANWARLTILQTSPADAYRALALDSTVTGTTAVSKVGVWPHYEDGVGQSANYVTLYLAGSAAPVDNATALQVQTALRPYIGLHDVLDALPAGTASYSPVLTVYVATLADVVPAALALYAALAALQTALDIGATCYAAGDASSSILGAVATVPQIKWVEQALTDFVPAKNALVTLGTGGIVGPLVGPPP